jgi:class 3 adenylate cyclase
VTGAPQTRYATTADGVHVAYQLIGDGPVDLVLLDVWRSPLEGRWDEPLMERPLRRLASFSRLISFDKRGVGCSDPVPFSILSTPEEWMNDVGTVMDAAGSERAVVLGINDGGPIAMLFAATHPERTSALILVNTAACVRQGPDYPWGAPPDYDWAQVEAETEELFRRYRWGRYAPSLDGDARLTEWFGKWFRLQASPGTALPLSRTIRDLDVRHVLPAIQSPTLVVRRRDSFLPTGMARYLAEHIDGALYAEVPGEDVWWAPPAEPLLDEIEAFITGERPVVEVDRVLATVLFTDIVSSTERATELGDRAWRGLLDRYRTAVRGQLRRFSGREINTRGDDFLATFDGPARAIRCALGIAEAAGALGIEVRTGLHTGEVELMGDDIGGIAVHIGARVSALAAPGEVLVTRTVVDLVAGSGIEFAHRGEHELKGVPGVWRLFAAEG